MTFHPVYIALKGVDFPVVGKHAKWLCKPPLRKRIGRIALMIDCKGAFKALVAQIRIEIGDLFGQHHAFVYDRTAGQRCNIELSNAGSGGGLFDAPADHIEFTLKGFFIDALAIADQNLFDFRARRIGFFAKAIHFYRHMTPTVGIVAHP